MHQDEVNYDTKMLQKKIGYINENPKKYAIVKASIDDPYIIDGVKRKW